MEALKLQLDRVKEVDSEKKEIYKEIAKITLERDHLTDKVTKL